MHRRLLTSVLLLGLLGSAVVAAESPRPGPGPAPRQPQTDQERFQGEWKIVYVEENGRAIDILVGCIAAFKAETFDLHEVGKPPRGGPSRYRLDAKQAPKQIDWILPGFDRTDIVHQGIYSLDGDSLRLLFSVDHNPRPTGFDPQSQKAGSLMLLKRVSAK
jgi:uncharacterized protein (TIGR03067 family)